MRAYLIFFTFISFNLFAQDQEQVTHVIKVDGKEFQIDVTIDPRQPDAHKELLEQSKHLDTLREDQRAEVQRRLKYYADYKIRETIQKSAEGKEKWNECKKTEDSTACLDAYLAEKMKSVTIKAFESCFDEFVKKAKEYECEEDMAFTNAPVERGPNKSLADLIKSDEEFYKDFLSAKKAGDAKSDKCKMKMNSNLSSFIPSENYSGPSKNYKCEEKSASGKEGPCIVRDVVELKVIGSSGELCGAGVPVCQMSYSCTGGEYKGTGLTMCPMKGDSCDNLKVEACIKDAAKFQKSQSKNSPLKTSESNVEGVK
jgi:hypothetical protein